MSWVFATATAWTAAVLLFSTAANAQSVCLPAPRLLTTTPMGGQAGTTVEVKIAGDHIEDAEDLRFSHPGITAAYKLDDKGLPVPNTYVVTIAADCPVGVHEARVMTRLGVSSSRAFNVGALPEVTRTTSNTSLETAMPLQVDSICNASVTRQAIDYFTFEAAQGQRIIVDCAAKGIDSKLKPVVVIADAEGGDLLVERRGGLLDFTVPISGTYVVKVHDLTFNGGNEYFYRLAVRQAAADEVVERQPSVRMVSAFSWPPTGLTDDNLIAELEPNNEHSEA
ncbi:MAG: serine protease, partial [Planctomycetota bacterium]